MSINTEADRRGLEAAGTVVRLTLDALAAANMRYPTRSSVRIASRNTASSSSTTRIPSVPPRATSRDGAGTAVTAPADAGK